MQEIQNVNGIVFDVKFKACGIVNFDENSNQKYFLPRVEGKGKKPENVKVGKKIWQYAGQTNYKNKDGEDCVKENYLYKNMVSANCIRHAIFEYGLPFTDTTLNNLSDDVINMTLAREDYLVRGYVLADKGVKRTSPLKFTDAIADMEWTPVEYMNLAVGTKSGDKTKVAKKKNESEDVEMKSTSLFKVETTGELDYISKNCYIDLAEMQFIALDGRQDRKAALGTNAKDWDSFFKALPCAVTPKHYRLSGASDVFTEEGVLLDADVVNTFVHNIFKNISAVSIRRTNAYFEFSEFVTIKAFCANGEIIEVKANELADTKFIVNPNYVVANEIGK